MRNMGPTEKLQDAMANGTPWTLMRGIIATVQKDDAKKHHLLLYRAAKYMLRDGASRYEAAVAIERFGFASVDRSGARKPKHRIPFPVNAFLTNAFAIFWKSIQRKSTKSITTSIPAE